MIATPWGPRAVPTGGAGEACPAGIWIFTMASTFFLAMAVLSELGDLAELELDRGLSTEDVDQHLDLELLLVDLDDLAGEVGERALLDPHGLALLVLEAGLLALGGLAVVGLDLQEGLDVLAAQRGGLGALADEAGDPRGVADHVPGVVVEPAADQEVAGEDLLLHDLLAAALELDQILYGDDDLVAPPLPVHRGDAGLEVGLHLLLVARLGVDHVPLAGTVVGALDR